ncbi:hypothetical protein U1Q18_043537 [Sarracenia purpurea var. burkii]
MQQHKFRDSHDASARFGVGLDFDFKFGDYHTGNTECFPEWVGIHSVSKIGGGVYAIATPNMIKMTGRVDQPEPRNKGQTCTAPNIGSKQLQLLADEPQHREVHRENSGIIRASPECLPNDIGLFPNQICVIVDDATTMNENHPNQQDHHKAKGRKLAEAEDSNQVLQWSRLCGKDRRNWQEIRPKCGSSWKMHRQTKE